MTIANPLYQKQSVWIGHRALNPDDAFPGIPTIMKQLEVHAEVSEASKQVVEKLKEYFPTKKVQKLSKKK